MESWRQGETKRLCHKPYLGRKGEEGVVVIVEVGRNGLDPSVVSVSRIINKALSQHQNKLKTKSNNSYRTDMVAVAEDGLDVLAPLVLLPFDFADTGLFAENSTDHQRQQLIGPDEAARQAKLTTALWNNGKYFQDRLASALDDNATITLPSGDHWLCNMVGSPAEQAASLVDTSSSNRIPKPS